MNYFAKSFKDSLLIVRPTSIIQEAIFHKGHDVVDLICRHSGFLSVAQGTFCCYGGYDTNENEQPDLMCQLPTC